MIPIHLGPATPRAAAVAARVISEVIEMSIAKLKADLVGQAGVDVAAVERLVAHFHRDMLQGAIRELDQIVANDDGHPARH
jgi:hypothetical protein